MRISEILDIKPGITALIGGGGKTTLMYTLARELSAFGRVIICTSTKILEPDFIPVLTDVSGEDTAAALKTSSIVCVGTKAAGGKLSAPGIGFAELEKLADYVIVEADGARGLPIKAHAGYEPVIPEGTNRTVTVIGADCFGKPISEICHRPELFAVLASADIASALTPELAARVISNEGFGDIVYINKVETNEMMNLCRRFADSIDLPVAAGSLKTEEYICLR